MHNYSIQLADSEHLADLPVIERAAAALFPAHLITPELRNGVVPLNQLEMARAEKRLWVALGFAGEVVGFALATATNDTAFLQEIDVHPQHQRQGLGRSLIQAVIDWAKQLRYASLTLTTFEHLPWNAPFYERLGFCKLENDKLSDDLRRRLHAEQQSGLRERVAMRLIL
jgi:GNAT superfamily N-acetyltransferase